MALFSTEHPPLIRQRFWRVVLTGLLTIAGAATAVAQESRGSISGRVVDSSGGVLPGVTVTIVNTGTNATNTVVTGDSGQFTAPLLISGTYRVTVELTGFRTVVREAVEVRVGDRLQVDFTLEPAGVSSEVVVVAESPLLDSGTATMGQVIDSKLIGEMPLGDGTAYGLARLVAGASFERSYALQRPMDNDNLRGLTISGTINSEFTIDGSSNIVSGARVGIQPPSDTIQEFKVETAVYDAQIGHTGAGNVNLALKSGTNELARRRFVLQPRRLAIGGPVCVEPARHRGDATRLQPLQRHDVGPHLPQPDVLHGVLRKAAGRHDRNGHQLGAQRPHASRRLLGAAGDRRADFRSGHRAAGQRRRDPGSVPREHHSRQPHQSHRPQRPELLSGAQPGRDRPTSRTTSLPSSRGPMATTCS